jgi:CheY-like chemotaxis protein
MVMRHEKVLVVDANEARRAELVGYLSEVGVETQEATNSEDALAALDVATFALVFAETVLPDKSGYYLLRQIKDRHPEVEVVLLAEVANSYNLLQALRQGAFDFIVRPLDSGEILAPTLERAARHLALSRKNVQLLTELERKSRAMTRGMEMMRALNASLERLTALSDIKELLQGLLDSALTVLGAKCGFIVLIERESGNIGVKIGQGYPTGTVMRNSGKLPPGFITEIVRKGKSLIVADTLPPDLAEIVNEAEKSRLLLYPGILAVPLMLRECEAGLVVLCGHPEDHPFTVEDLHYLEQLSRHTALVLERVGTMRQSKSG